MIRKAIAAIIFLFLVFSNTVFGFGKKYDLVITNARIIDGTGNPWFYGEVAVKNGRISKITKRGQLNSNDAKSVIDARNQIVSPGFIDVHSHTESIYQHPKAENFIRMGVTTLVTGNCGGSTTEVAKFLGNVRNTPLAINISTLIGHNSVRKEIMGLEDRDPTVDEQKQMDALVERAMREGAVGLSTGLIYVPGTFSKTPEVVSLAKAAAKYNGIYASHIRDESTKVFEAIKEAIDIGEQAGMPVEISHFKISSKALWGQSDKTIELVKAARERGVQVTVDQYAYTASSTSLDARMPTWAIAGGREEGKKRLADPETRKKIAEDLKEALKKKNFEDLSFAYVAYYKPAPEFNGKNLKQIAKIARGDDSYDSQIEQMFEMYEKGGAEMVYHIMSEEDVSNIMKQPFTMIAADSELPTFGLGMPHPREYGDNARVLGHYVRNVRNITLEDAIRKMTSLPAETFGFEDRGLLREGSAADIVIFDEETVSDSATFENPHQYAKGFSAVIVNGETVFDGEKMTGKMSGKALYGPGTNMK
ncbi:MAG: N-acyl-D-amino-acid deacylase family protein [Pyrinomonadaceae bacterium]